MELITSVMRDRGSHVELSCSCLGQLLSEMFAVKYVIISGEKNLKYCSTLAPSD